MKTLDVEVKPGKYVLAVSGGVDSMVLLNLMQECSGVRITVAHFDHGIRSDSEADRKLVQAAAKFYGLPFVYERVELGSGTSEQEARRARYQFLRAVQKAAKASAIITAHHQDDVLETAMLNMIRGTGRHGLSSLQSRPGLMRPLLGYSKLDILAYARNRDLVWHEDSTNIDSNYKRNYVRQNLITKMSTQVRSQLLEFVETATQLNTQIDDLEMGMLHQQIIKQTLGRLWFIGLSHAVATDVMATWLRQHIAAPFDANGLERLVIAAKTKVPGTTIDVVQGAKLCIHKQYLALTS